jgi:hypothetical protein
MLDRDLPMDHWQGDAATISSHVELTEVSLHNRSWMVVSGDQYAIVKQPDTSREPDVLRLLASGDSPALRAFLPALEAEDCHAGGIRISGIPHSKTLREAFDRSFPLPQTVLSRIGEGLGHCHLFGQLDHDTPALQEAMAGLAADHRFRTPPWVFDLAQPASTFLSASSAGNHEMVKTLQQFQELPELLAALRKAWEASGLVHNDLKWDNILAHPKDGETELTQVKIIDWEMAGIGDPCWDVGTMLSEFVAFWALSIPVVGGEPYEDLAKYPIEDMQPAIRAFWDSYAEGMAFDRTMTRERLLKSVRFAGARLIQTSFERAQTMTHPTPHIFLLLQLSLNIMAQPEDAVEGLFGIPLAGAAGE